MQKKDESPHWITNLFPPTFTCDNANNTANGRNDSLLDGQIKALDVQDVRSVYLRVLNYLAAEKEAARISASDLILEKEGKNGNEKKNCQVELSADNLEGEEIWSESDLSVLRCVIKENIQEKRKLTAIIQVQNEELVNLRSRYKEDNDLLDKRTLMLQEANEANQRFQVMMEQLKNDLHSCRIKNTRFTSVISDLRMQIIDLYNHIKELNLSGEQLQRDKRRVEIKLLDMERESSRATFFQLEEQKVSHDLEKAKFMKQIEELRNEFVKENESHSIDKQALSHLRMHFSSLPLHEHNLGSRTKTLKKLQSY